MPSDHDCLRVARSLCVCFLAGLGLLARPSPAAETPAGAISSVEIGIQGRYKIGNWTRLQLTVTESVGPCNLVVSTNDPDGNHVRFEKSLTGISPDKPATILFQAGRIDSPTIIRLVAADSGKLIDRRELRPKNNPNLFQLTDATHLVLAVGTPSGLDFNLPEPAPAEPPIEVISLSNHSEIPTHPDDLGSVDVIVMAGRFDLAPACSATLQQWVHAGGHLVLAVGSESPSLQQGPLTSWLPFQVKEPRRLRNLSALETYVGRSERIPFSRSITATIMESPHGVDLVNTLEGAIAGRAIFGFGRVTWLGLDLHQGPLTEWARTGDLLGKLTDLQKVSESLNDEATSDQLADPGVTDLASQLANSVQRFDGINRLTTQYVMAIILGYILIIGPVDYFLVRKLLNKPMLTWMTFPVSAAAVTFLAITLANQNNGTELHLNQVDIVDIDNRTATTRTSTLAALYSAEASRYTIALTPTGANLGGPPSTRENTSARLSWFGAPEEAYGGMYRQAGLEMQRPSYGIPPSGTEIEELPIAHWSVRLLHNTAYQSSAPQTQSRLEAIGGQLRGSFDHSLAEPIEDWILAYGRQVFWPRDPESRINKLPPGQPLNLTDSRIASRDLSGLLTGTTRTRIKRDSGRGADITTEQHTYDILSTDTAEIVRILTFHDAVDGSRYTNLDNTSLRHLDLTPLLQLNTAILFGRVTSPATTVTCNDETQTAARNDTFVRILLPVSRFGPARTQLAPRPDELPKTFELKQ